MAALMVHDSEEMQRVGIQRLPRQQGVIAASGVRVAAFGVVTKGNEEVGVRSRHETYSRSGNGRDEEQFVRKMLDYRSYHLVPPSQEPLG